MEIIIRGSGLFLLFLLRNTTIRIDPAHTKIRTAIRPPTIVSIVLTAALLGARNERLLSSDDGCTDLLGESAPSLLLDDCGCGCGCGGWHVVRLVSATHAAAQCVDTAREKSLHDHEVVAPEQRSASSIDIFVNFPIRSTVERRLS
jgi:hypothetical protein